MKMKDQRKEKIRELKNTIKTKREEVSNLFSNLNINEELALPEEERVAKQQAFKDTLAINKAEIKSAEEELKLVRMNKYSSSFFEWQPHVGMNRASARKARKLMGN